MKLRAIKQMNFPASDLAPVPDWRPTFRVVPITDLLIDGDYQRDLKPQSIKLIRKIAREFNWAHLKPPIVVPVGDKWHVINGQHTAIAAFTIGITDMPVFVVRGEKIIDRARAFVSHNTDNIRITRLDIHRAMVAAGDAFACGVQKVCDDVGVHFVELGAYDPRVGDTKSVASIMKCAKVHGIGVLRTALRALVRAKRAPVTEYEIKAACKLAGDVSAEQLYLAIRAGGDDAVARARMNGIKQKRQAWQCMIDIWHSSVAA